MAESYTLSPEAARQIQRLVREQVRRETRPNPRGGSDIQAIYIAKTGGSGIPALSGTTPGTADVTLQRVNASGDLEAAKNDDDEDVTVEAWNLSSSAVAASVYIHLKQEIISGKLLVDFEDCG